MLVHKPHILNLWRNVVNKVILEDTRQKLEKNAHIRKQLIALGYEVNRCRLYCGDYSWATNQAVCVDTKANMGEIESNLVHDHERFREECIRAKDAGIQLYMLIQDQKIKSVSDVFGWYNPRIRYSPKAVTGRQLGKMMISMEQKYSVKLNFCTKNEVGQRI